MRKNNLSIHSENILPIIKQWLYTDQDIFLRELISNACDALSKLKVLGHEGPFEISLEIDRDAKKLILTDTGIGMTEEEVEKYIAQIAFSGAQEFVSKYQANDAIIGHFGLGFYSAYMVASKVEIDTRSFQENAQPVYWSCDGTSSYEIGAGKRSERGTQITLTLNEDSLDYLDESKLRALLLKHSRFLPYPIHLAGKVVGGETPLWMKAPSECTDKDYLEFYRTLHPADPDPIFWIHLNVDYPFHLQGILYFPKIHRKFDPSHPAIQLYCNRVFVSENCKEILPDYLSILKGVIDSPDIPLNVSRSTLQLDKKVKQLSGHISKKVSDRLTTLLKTDRKKYIESWPDIEMIVKLGILQEEKFYERIQEALIWKNNLDEWTTLLEYLERNPNKKVLYAVEDRTGVVLQAYKEKKTELLFSNAYIDTALLSFLEEKHACKFQRVDSSLDETLLDPSREQTILDAEGKTAASRIAEFIRKAVGVADVEAKSFASDAIPGMVVLREEERRLRDYLTLTQGKQIPDLLSKKTFVVNTNNRLVQAIGRLQNRSPEVAENLAKHLFDLTLLAQKELEPSQVEQVVARQTTMLETLAGMIG